MKKNLIQLLSVIVLALLCNSEVLAVGALFARPRFSTAQYQTMWIKNVQTTVSIEEQIAVTHVDQTFNNTLNTSVETIFMFPLPESATVSELVYWVNGQRFVAEIRERSAAVQAYNNQVRSWMDPALLEYLGNNLFRLSIVPVAANSDVRTEITYVEPLNYEFGKISYDFRLNTLGLSSKPLQKVTLNVDATTKFSYKYFTSPSHQNSTGASMTKLADNHYQFMYGDENYYPNKDFTIEFATKRSEIEFDALSYKPTVSDSMGTDSFYAIWISPPDSVNTQNIIPKDIVFTADVSSSMDGTRMAQIKESLNYFVSLLAPYDKFNIITFGTFVKAFKPDLVSATTENITAAKDFINQLYALGLTNINEALTTSLKQSYQDSTSNNIIFFTDGYPTWGDTLPANILNNVKQNNTKGTRIFSFGVGEEVSKAFLQDLASQNHGYSKFITTNDSIAIVVENHFKKISYPVLTDISIVFEGAQPYDIYPKTYEDLFWGNQVLQYGLYKTGGFYNITLKGKIRSNPVEYKQYVYLSDSTGSGHRFVPRLWAENKINYLLNLIATYGETKELVNQIIELSERFQILTPYTAFYIDPTTVVKPDKNKTEITDFVLRQNYPNPFNPDTRISYSLPAGKASYRVIVRVYNTLGQLVRTLVNREQTPGNYTVTWDGKDTFNKAVASGVYLYTIETGDVAITKKMVLLR